MKVKPVPAVIESAYSSHALNCGRQLRTSHLYNYCTTTHKRPKLLVVTDANEDFVTKVTADYACIFPAHGEHALHKGVNTSVILTLVCG